MAKQFVVFLLVGIELLSVVKSDDVVSINVTVVDSVCVIYGNPQECKGFDLVVLHGRDELMHDPGHTLTGQIGSQQAYFPDSLFEGHEQLTVKSFVAGGERIFDETNRTDTTNGFIVHFEGKDPYKLRFDLRIEAVCVNNTCSGTKCNVCPTSSTVITTTNNMRTTFRTTAHVQNMNTSNEVTSISTSGISSTIPGQTTDTVSVSINTLSPIGNGTSEISTSDNVTLTNTLASNGKIPTGAIVGIVAGIIILLVILIVVVYKEKWFVIYKWNNTGNASKNKTSVAHSEDRRQILQDQPSHSDDSTGPPDKPDSQHIVNMDPKYSDDNDKSKDIIGKGVKDANNKHTVPNGHIVHQTISDHVSNEDTETTSSSSENTRNDQESDNLSIVHDIKKDNLRTQKDEANIKIVAKSTNEVKELKDEIQNTDTVEESGVTPFQTNNNNTVQGNQTVETYDTTPQETENNKTSKENQVVEEYDTTPQETENNKTSKENQVVEEYDTTPQETENNKTSKESQDVEKNDVTRLEIENSKTSDQNQYVSTEYQFRNTEDIDSDDNVSTLDAIESPIISSKSSPQRITNAFEESRQVIPESIHQSTNKEINHTYLAVLMAKIEKNEKLSIDVAKTNTDLENTKENLRKMELELKETKKDLKRVERNFDKTKQDVKEVKTSVETVGQVVTDFKQLYIANEEEKKKSQQQNDETVTRQKKPTESSNEEPENSTKKKKKHKKKEKDEGITFMVENGNLTVKTPRNRSKSRSRSRSRGRSKSRSRREKMTYDEARPVDNSG